LTEYTPHLHCAAHHVSDLNDPNAADWIKSYTAPKLGRICDLLAHELLSQRLPTPRACAPLRAIRIDIDAYEDTVVGWSLRLPQIQHSNIWQALGQTDAERQRYEVLVTSALRGCLVPRYACYSITYRVSTEGLSSHERIDLASKAISLQGLHNE
jgi:hypothetical protein